MESFWPPQALLDLELAPHWRERTVWALPALRKVEPELRKVALALGRWV